MTKDEFAELFSLRVRGVLAAAFSHSDTTPTDEQWKMLRGECEITERDIGEIGWLTDCEMQFQAIDRSPQETTND